MSLFAYCLFYYLLAGLAMNVGYHRGLSHRSFVLNKTIERIFVTLGLPAGTPIQWVGNHRYHHAHSDEEGDPHSPVVSGFWYAHVGWYIGTRNPVICFLYSCAGPIRTIMDGWMRPRTNQQFNYLAQDISVDNYYRFISRPINFFFACLVHVIIFLGTSYYFWGATGVFAAWITSIVVYNVGDSIDSFSHLFGKRPFTLSSHARNNWILSILALGDGWHANHHTFPESARHGLLKGQFDWSWMIISFLKRLGLADGIIIPPEEKIKGKMKKIGESYLGGRLVRNKISR